MHHSYLHLQEKYHIRVSLASKIGIKMIDEPESEKVKEGDVPSLRVA